MSSDGSKNNAAAAAEAGEGTTKSKRSKGAASRKSSKDHPSFYDIVEVNSRQRPASSYGRFLTCSRLENNKLQEAIVASGDKSGASRAYIKKSVITVFPVSLDVFAVLLRGPV